MKLAKSIYKNTTAKKRKNSKFKEDSRDRVKIYTDGSYVEESRSGGWSSIIITNGNEQVYFSGMGADSAEQMELMAVTIALSKLRNPSVVKLFTDCLNIVNVMRDCNYKYYDECNNYQELWGAIRLYDKIHLIDWIHVRSHQNNQLNIKADKLAKRGRINYESNRECIYSVK